ncbi:hypothetical protein [Streptococcus macacae]|uniref:Uncharacterized protein n=1 Tax=Streptococcus macacae NCTC 11558 TaxID=764298 RepID=G5JXW1_9STRE|nr:hypothetical protein [Streptococcus macacae]EHJ51614.1 hypothetical protein STRMA_0006 [Streptococcus macacae NCTC 11558]SUN77883.1 lipoprotein, putative [Streptococcus macacae NCTC 11558]
MKRSTKITLISLTTLAILAGIGGSLMVANDFNSRFEAFVKAKRDQEAKEAKKKKQEDKMTTKEKQVAYLKEHQQEIVDFVKQSNPKIESVQIDWTDVRWGEAGNGTPQGGGDIVNIYGTFNNIEDSGWNVTIEIKDGQPDMDTMMLTNGLSIGGQPFE